MRSSVIGSRTLRDGVVAASYAGVGARTIVMAYLAICSIGFGDARADNAIEQATEAPVASEITCGGRPGRPYEADGAGGRNAHLAPIVDTIAAAPPTWKTIILGTHKNADALRGALKAAGCRVGNLASEVLERPAFTVSKSRIEVDLTVLSVADLGFGAAGASRAEVYKRATRLGLGLCPAEVAPQLRLQYADQPLGEFLRIAMAPMVTTGGDFVVLGVANGGAGLLLIADDAHPNLTVPPSVRFVFVRHPTGRPPAAAAAQRIQRVEVKD